MMIAGVLDVRELMSISGLGVKTKNCKN
jgi:hypothetical protein